MLETLDTIRIGSTPTFLYFDLYLYSAYAEYIYIYICIFELKILSMHTTAILHIQYTRHASLEYSWRFAFNNKQHSIECKHMTSYIFVYLENK